MVGTGYGAVRRWACTGRTSTWTTDPTTFGGVGVDRVRYSHEGAAGVGHSTFSVTADIYSHVGVTQQREAAERLGTAFQW